MGSSGTAAWAASCLSLATASNSFAAPEFGGYLGSTFCQICVRALQALSCSKPKIAKVAVTSDICALEPDHRNAVAWAVHVPVLRVISDCATPLSKAGRDADGSSRNARGNTSTRRFPKIIPPSGK